MMWMMLQQDKPQDFVIATERQISVRDFVGTAAAELGVTLRFEGTGLEEKGIVEAIAGDEAPALKPGDLVIAADQRYFRPAEVETLLGDATKAKRELGWEPEIILEQLCAEMVAEDLAEASGMHYSKRKVSTPR